MSWPTDKAEIETLLERYLDGELEPSLVPRVESALESSEEYRRHLDELTQIRMALREDVAAAVASAPLDQLWDRISVALDEETGLEAVPDPPPEPSRPGLIEQLKRWWETQRLEAALGAMAAVAAIALCVWFVQSMPGAATTTETPVAESEAPADNTLIVESAEAEQGTIVIDVDPEDPTAPAVVWHLMDEEEG